MTLPALNNPPEPLVQTPGPIDKTFQPSNRVLVNSAKNYSPKKQTRQIPSGQKTNSPNFGQLAKKVVFFGELTSILATSYLADTTFPPTILDPHLLTRPLSSVATRSLQDCQGQPLRRQPRKEEGLF